MSTMDLVTAWIGLTWISWNLLVTIRFNKKALMELVQGFTPSKVWAGVSYSWQDN